MVRKILRCILVFTFLVGCLPMASQALLWPGISLAPLLSGSQRPVSITNARDGSGRLFIVEQIGTIRIALNGALLPSPFLNITPKVLSGGEQGLLGLAFPPNFATSRHFYVYYTSLTGDNVVARYTLSGNPNLAERKTFMWQIMQQV